MLGYTADWILLKYSYFSNMRPKGKAKKSNKDKETLYAYLVIRYKN